MHHFIDSYSGVRQSEELNNDKAESAKIQANENDSIDKNNVKFSISDTYSPLFVLQDENPESIRESSNSNQKRRKRKSNKVACQFPLDMDESDYRL